MVIVTVPAALRCGGVPMAMRAFGIDVWPGRSACSILAMFTS